MRPKKYARRAVAPDGRRCVQERRGNQIAVNDDQIAAARRPRQQRALLRLVSCPHSSVPMTTARSDVYPSQLVGSRAGSSRKSSGGHAAPTGTLQ